MNRHEDIIAHTYPSPLTGETLYSAECSRCGQSVVSTSPDAVKDHMSGRVCRPQRPARRWAIEETVRHFRIPGMQ